MDEPAEAERAAGTSSASAEVATAPSVEGAGNNPAEPAELAAGTSAASAEVAAAAPAQVSGTSAASAEVAAAASAQVCTSFVVSAALDASAAADARRSCCVFRTYLFSTLTIMNLYIRGREFRFPLKNVEISRGEAAVILERAVWLCSRARLPPACLNPRAEAAAWLTLAAQFEGIREDAFLNASYGGVRQAELRGARCWAVMQSGPDADNAAV